MDSLFDLFRFLCVFAKLVLIDLIAPRHFIKSVFSAACFESDQAKSEQAVRSRCSIIAQSFEERKNFVKVLPGFID